MDNEVLKLNYYLNQSFLEKFKICLEKITNERDPLKKIQLVTEEFKKNNEFLESTLSSLQSEINELKIHIAESYNRIEFINSEEYIVNKEKMKIFLLSQKLLYYEFQIKQLKNQNKVLKFRVCDVDLFQRDPNVLMKVLDQEVNYLRDHTSKQSKTLNQIKQQIEDANKVISSLKEELNQMNSNNPKTLLVIPKMIDTVIYEMQRVDNKTVVYHDPIISKLKSDINHNQDLIEDLNSQIDHYNNLNVKLKSSNKKNEEELSIKQENLKNLIRKLTLLKEEYSSIK